MRSAAILACLVALAVARAAGAPGPSSGAVPMAPTAGATQQPVPGLTPDGIPGASLTWKAALLTGDAEIQAFDNARRTLERELLSFGLAPDHVRELSMNPVEQTGGVRQSSAANLQRALVDLHVGPGDACLIHLTSHGNRNGFFMENGPTLTPRRLNAIVEAGCGAQPTVILVSACYSGVFVHDEMLKPNRIILTAAEDDRTSFGCSSESEYTYWDSCLIDNLPKADTWKTLATGVTACVETKERRGRFRPSLPQAYFGDAVADLKIPAPAASATTEVSSACPVSTDETYGYFPANPIEVGLDAATGPARETKYLNALRGPAGQVPRFRRAGSEVNRAGTIVDLYEITYDGLSVPAHLYLDEYHFTDPTAPKGFICGVAIGLK